MSDRLRAICPDCKQIVMFSKATCFAVDKVTLENRPGFKCEMCGSVHTDTGIRRYQEQALQSTPKDVANYFEKMFGSAKSEQRYVETLVNHFNRQIISYLLIEFMRQQEDPQGIADAIMETWRSAVKQQQAAEAKTHADMSQTALGKMLSGKTGDGEDLRLFMKKTRK